MALLEARGLVKTFATVRVVDGIDLTCDRGEVLGVLGPNGAGKTTTLKMLYGFLTPEAGSIRIDGQDFAGHRTAIKRRIGVCPQDDTLDAGFDVIGNLRTFAGLDRLALAGGDAASGAVSISGGKYLTNNVYLEITGGGRDGAAAQVEWRMKRNLSIVSRVGGQGSGRLAVRWRRDY